jgi:ParB family transcriptional regulator, chromosome partitioning protein
MQPVFPIEEPAMEKRTALGKGLSALIPDAPPIPPRSDAPVSELDIDALAPNDVQPRLQMDDARLEELTASIRSHGVIQPIVVRKTEDGFGIIAGERRWRAAKRAGLTRVPVVFKDVAAERASQNLLELALIENIQREDLNPIDEAKAYRRLVDEFHLTQDAVASAVGKDRATIANTLRLLKLPAEVQNDVASSALSMGHARALLALPGDAAQLQAAREVKTRGLSVRETEALVKSALEGHEIGAPTPRQAKPPAPPDVHTRAAEDKLKIQLGTRVRIVRKARGGRIEIDFTSEDELIRIYDALMGQ